MGTTSVGFNLFLCSTLAEKARREGLASAQRGIGFSVCGAVVISILIMIVGDGVGLGDDDDDFTIASLADLIEETVGLAGLLAFSIGFIAAAVSSMITVSFGAAVTADSMFTDMPHGKS